MKPDIASFVAYPSFFTSDELPRMEGRSEEIIRYEKNRTRRRWFSDRLPSAG